MSRLSRLRVIESPLTTRAVVLQALVNGETYGSRLVEHVHTLTEGRVLLHDGALYPALTQLEAEGCVESHLEHGPLGGRPRRVFRLLPSGYDLGNAHMMIAAKLYDWPVSKAV